MTAVAARASVRFEPADSDGIGRIVIDRPDDAVNAIDLEMIDGLSEAIGAARAAAPKGLVLASGKPEQFVAGADLKLVTNADEPELVETAARRLQAVADELAWLPFTTVAAIGGPALGGGLELALACDYRVASESAGVTLGQPEVNLGLVPAGGGTQRLPRLIGLQRSMDLILSGRRLNARRARRAGIVDDVVHPSVLNDAARLWAAKAKRPLDRPVRVGFNTDTLELTRAGREVVYRQARKSVMDRTHGHYLAPLRALECIERGFEHGMAAGLEAEARAFGELATTETARNLIWLFLATQRAKRRAKRVDRLAVVGAGFMGAAIAEVAAASGVAVRVKDISAEAVARGLATVRKLVDSAAQRRRIDNREARAIQGRVTGSSDYSGFGRAEVVIEAVFEDLALKRRVVRDLEDVVSPATVIASNTSAIPIHEIASTASHPERIVGMHFFSPAERMPLLEVVRPAAASEEAISTAVRLGAQIGKTVIVVGDSPGFYTSRVLGVMLNEAALLVGEGARLEDVDRALTDFGFPVGPFVLYDEVGLEVVLHAGETVARAFGDRIPFADIVTTLVSRGDTGRKRGRGFYIWPRGRTFPLIVKTAGKKANPVAYADRPRRHFSAREIQDRLVLLFVNEAVRCLDEGVLQSPTDGDLGAVLGVGFPPFRGGPFHYADSSGAHALANKLRDLAERHGTRFSPADSLAQGRTFFQEHE